MMDVSASGQIFIICNPLVPLERGKQLVRSITAPFQGSWRRSRLKVAFWGDGFPVAVPEKIIGLTPILDFFDRCHSAALRASLRSVALCTPTAVGGLRLASPATGSARARGQIFTGFASSNLYPLIKNQPSRLG